MDETEPAASPAAPRGIDPISILALLCLAVILLSIIGAAAGWSAINLGTGERVTVTSMLAAENIRHLLAEMPSTFFGFEPLGMVVLIMLGAGFAEKVGLIGAALRAALKNVPVVALTPAIVVIGIVAHIGTDAAYFVVIPFAGYAFAAAGRHPLTGICAAFAGVGGGYGANLLVTPTDVAVYGITEAAARVVDPSVTIDILANYFLLATFAVLVTIIVTLVTDLYLEKRIDRLFSRPMTVDTETIEAHRGLGISLGVILLIVAIGAALGLAPGAPLRMPDGDLRPFYKSFIAIVFLAMLGGGLVFGFLNGRLRRDSDVFALMQQALAETAPFLLLIFFAAHFGAFLGWTHLAEVGAAKAAAGLRDVQVTGVPLILAFSALTAVLNLILPSTSAKWAIMAPTAVPMMMGLGISPEMTAAAYRIGASASELLTPTAMTPIVFVFAQRYARELGFGRFLGLMVPYAAAIFFGGMALLFAWASLDLPLGPSGAHASLAVAER